ncbi:hypothetical protein GGR55DRAFT_637986 [Xylaria sp. FL0064]|nr:hypothetical protein GGR55DRAFT_637986 [Xylaria sp. FL0064]
MLLVFSLSYSLSFLPNSIICFLFFRTVRPRNVILYVSCLPPTYALCIAPNVSIQNMSNMKALVYPPTLYLYCCYQVVLWYYKTHAA